MSEALDMLVTAAANTDAVRKLEHMIHQSGAPEVQLNAQLVVHAGMAARTIFIPAGTLLTGVLTNCDNLCIVMGDITVTTREGPRRLTGYTVLPAFAGFKRAGIALADTWWTTIHHTELTDRAEIENEMSAEADQLQTRRCLEHTQTTERIAP
jgi:hypothetical protein